MRSRSVTIRSQNHENIKVNDLSFAGRPALAHRKTMQIEIAFDPIYYPRQSNEKSHWQLCDLSTTLFKMPKRCSQTKLMDMTDIFNKLAVNCELSKAEVYLPYMAQRRRQQAATRWTLSVSGRRHLRSSSGSRSSSNSPHYGRIANSVSYRSGDNHNSSNSSCSSSGSCSYSCSNGSGNSGNGGSCSGSSSCRSVISSWSRDHNVLLAPNNWPIGLNVGSRPN